MDKIVINQELLLLLQKNKIIATTSNFNYRDQAVISLIKTLITMGYNSSDILELIDEEMTLLDILEFHQDLVINKQYECCCLINKLKKMIEEVLEKKVELKEKPDILCVWRFLSLERKTWKKY